MTKLKLKEVAIFSKTKTKIKSNIFSKTKTKTKSKPLFLLKLKVNGITKTTLLWIHGTSYLVLFLHLS